MDIVRKPKRCMTPPPQATPSEDLSAQEMRMQHLHPQGMPIKREE